ncbi:helix-turn-helix transcriptional regulator [Salinisphaera sp. SWV1]|uniref:helix-turn-helix transcriptional regulator n=1 Tax=Salinisphaera sp. SWV1 TaxID=3454139 RepID=UPI003F852DD8
MRSDQSTADTSVLADYYTRDELAAELGKTTRTLARWAWLRTGPRQTRVGNRIYYHQNDVRDWLQKQKEVTA